MAIAGLSTLAFAASSFYNSAMMGQLVNAAMAGVNCRTNLTVSFLNDVITTAPGLSTSLNYQLTSIRQRTAQLQNYSNMSNATDFRNYVKSTYDPYLNQIRTGLIPSIRGENLSANAIALIRGDYAPLASQYSICSYNALRRFAIAKENSYNGVMTYYQQRVANLSSRGLNTTALTALLNKANSQIIVPYQNGINNATTSNQIESVLGEYCLFDDCQNGMNFHLAANFDLLKLEAVYQKIKSIKNLTANQTSQLTKVGSDLNATSAALASVGTSAYTPSTAQSVFGDLNQTVNDIRILFKTH